MAKDPSELPKVLSTHVFIKLASATCTSPEAGGVNVEVRTSADKEKMMCFMFSDLSKGQTSFKSKQSGAGACFL